MYIKKQRLLTPGPTPLLPSALHAMMGSDIHHRTEDFRTLYKQVLADLKTVLGTANDVLVLVASGSGGLEAATQNFFSTGDEVLVCSAGKFGERWVDIMKAWGMKATVLTAPYGDAVQPEAVEQALAVIGCWISQRLALLVKKEFRHRSLAPELCRIGLTKNLRIAQS